MERPWEARGSWRRLWERLAAEDCPLTRPLFLREQLLAEESVPGIPPKSHWTAPLDEETARDQRREQGERYFNHLKQLRRLATRDEKWRQTFLALMHLVAAWMIIK